MSSLRIPAILLVLLVALHLHGVLAVNSSYFIRYNNTCRMNAQLPAKSEGLEFCTKHNSKACCAPAHDSAIVGMYNAIASLGNGCAISKHEVKAVFKELREWLCLPCDPNEPNYRYQVKKGDGIIGGDASVDENVWTWRVCRSFLYGHASSGKGLWGKDGSKYNYCGLTSVACGKTTFWSYDSTISAWISKEEQVSGPPCGGDVIFPKIEFAEADDPASAFLHTIPQIIPDFSFVVINDSAVNYSFERQPCFGRRTAGAAHHLFSLGATAMAGLMGIALSLLTLL